MNKGLNLEISSNLDYEGMVINIVYNQEKVNFSDKKKYYIQKEIATLNQDKGIENIEIKLYPSQSNEDFEFSYKEFMEVLVKAKILLLQINKDRN